MKNPDFESLLPRSIVNRRDFLAATGAAGFALAVQPVCAQTTISTDAAGLSVGSATITVDGGALPVYHAAPAGKSGLPVVLVVQEIFGVHEHIRDVCRRLARLGYLAVAPELYFRQGDPQKLDSVGAILDGIVSKVPDAQVMSDLDACVAWAGQHGGDTARLAITGFCWGGRITWLYAAHNPALKAGVAWYGRIDGAPSPLTPKQPIDVVDDIKAPVLGLYGAKDQGIPASDVEMLRDALHKAGKTADFVIYPEAGHAFHADYRPSYRKAEAEDGWKRLVAWFGKYV
ncbi:dienelactone hydrolase family protein [Cognatazoarcus halotolerans]|uniref:dienelactone hydrolase family protein n=1 Tax=Cognatazoarcus halotolerans TaxID=2686016 RepID=UPI00135CB0DC|nr:dienelactone hydrolase family protein [Cognatazoarcus halotolerans]MCP5307784.1 dienelactone hydrolase family protein [Zoogloeaceae bacterium]